MKNQHFFCRFLQKGVQLQKDHPKIIILLALSQLDVLTLKFSNIIIFKGKIHFHEKKKTYFQIIFLLNSEIRNIRTRF